MRIHIFGNEDQASLKELQQFQDSLHGESSDNAVDKSNFLKGFMAYSGDKPEAGVVLFRTELSSPLPVLFFGHIEARSLDTGSALMNTMVEYCRAHHPAHKLIGPVNSSTWSQYRLALDNASPLFPGDIAGNLLYPAILANCGFAVLHRYYTNLQSDMTFKKPVKLDDFKIRYVTKDKMVNLLDEIYEMTMDAFRLSPLFNIAPPEAFRQKYRQQLQYLNTGLMPLVFGADGKLAGYAVCYPAYDSEAMVVKTIARKTGREYAGVGRMLAAETVRLALDNGYKKQYHAFMFSDNHSANLSELFNGVRARTYAVYYLNI